MRRLKSGTEMQWSPYPHLSIDRFFARHLYDQIIEHFPGREVSGWKQNNNTARCRRGGLCEQWSIGTKGFRAESTPSWPFNGWSQSSSANTAFWSGFHAAINSDEMMIAWLVAFAATIHPRYATSKAQAKSSPRTDVQGTLKRTRDVYAWAQRLLQSEDLQMQFGLRFSAPGYALEPHTDVCGKLVSWLLFLPDDHAKRPRLQKELTADGRRLTAKPNHPERYAKPQETPYGSSGTTIYKAQPSAPIKRTRCGETLQTFKGYQEVARAPYAHNSMFAFASCATSWHGVSSTTERRTIFFFLSYAHSKQKDGVPLGSNPPLQASCPTAPIWL